MALGYKTGGRKPGTPNKASKDVQLWVDQVFKAVDPTEMALKFIQCDQPKVAAAVFLRMMEYRYGKPTEHIKAELTMDYAQLLTKMRERVQQD